MTAPPPISIVLPFYNAGATIDETLDTIQAQTLADFELVAVDDGSDDDSAERVAARAAADARIRLFRESHGGQVAAMNTALARSRAPLIARIDADDHMHPERLQLQHAFMQTHPDVALVGSRVSLFPAERITEGAAEYIGWQNACLSPEAIAAAIYVELPIAHPSVMFRKAAVTANGGYREGPFPEDYELLLRLHQRGCRLAKLPEVLTHWRDSDGRLTRTDPRYAREAFDGIRATYLARDPRLHGPRPLAFWGAGRKTRRRVDRLLAHGFRPHAWIDIDPRKIGNRLHGVPVVAPEWLEKQRPPPFVLAYVANHGARELIAEALERMRYRRGEDYLMVG